MHFSNGSHITIKDVLHVPQLAHSLMLVGLLDDNGYKVIFVFQSFRIMKGNMIVAKENKIGSLYPLFFIKKNICRLSN